MRRTTPWNDWIRERWAGGGGGGGTGGGGEGTRGGREGDCKDNCEYNMKWQGK